MKYSVEIERGIESLMCCLRDVSTQINEWEWNVIINAGGIDYGIYFNFDIDKKELEISNQPQYDESLELYEIIDIINPDNLDDD